MSLLSSTLQGDNYLTLGKFAPSKTRGPSDFSWDSSVFTFRIRGVPVRIATGRRPIRRAGEDRSRAGRFGSSLREGKRRKAPRPSSRGACEEKIGVFSSDDEEVLVGHLEVGLE